MPPNLSEIERKILDYMVAYLRTNTYQPSIREIGERFGIKSTKTVSEHLQALAEKGFLERDPSRSRGVKILGVDLTAQAVSLPCFSRLPEDRSGQRASRAESFISLDQRLAGGNGAFLVLARADEMASLGLVEGDYVLMEPASSAEVPEGAVVAARVDGKAGYYRFSRKGHSILLQSLGGKGDALAVDDPAALTLLGRVTGMFRRLDLLPPSATAFAH